jgi:hypothetical protein
MKQAKPEWLHHTSNLKEENSSEIRREAIRYFKKTKRKLLKVKIKQLEKNCNNKTIRHRYRGMNEFQKDYQHRTNLVKDERRDLLANPLKILNRWKNYFCQLLNLDGAGCVKQI